MVYSTPPHLRLTLIIIGKRDHLDKLSFRSFYIFLYGPYLNMGLLLFLDICYFFQCTYVASAYGTRGSCC